MAPNGPEDALKQRKQDIGVLASLLVAALAGAGNQLCTMPMSVISTRMQAQGKLRIESGRADIPTGARHVISAVWRESGLAGFWAGLLPALILVVNPAVQYCLYEQIQRLMRRWKRKRYLQTLAQVVNTAGDDAARPHEGPEEADFEKLSAADYFVASALAKIGATGVLAGCNLEA